MGSVIRLAADFVVVAAVAVVVVVVAVELPQRPPNQTKKTRLLILFPLKFRIP